GEDLGRPHLSSSGLNPRKTSSPASRFATRGKKVATKLHQALGRLGPECLPRMAKPLAGGDVSKRLRERDKGGQKAIMWTQARKGANELEELKSRFAHVFARFGTA